ncbi:selenocysteine insertion sequence-binding protein 2 isoform X2 [Sceloporus undulatus]|uniref:selenocysteine insertion sequence-binding protein 2 isoform X2 n=1 Tax=Sceloporus undulatus TaxID=8520 RepID=UPI001C4CC0E6|nr:selenocysteine insertion sequence-binding protein 2 isoform X2 [Sceloporus undulatus]
MGCSSLGEYTSSPYTPDAAPNLYTVNNFQCDNNSSKIFSSSRQDRDYVKQSPVIRKEAAYHPRRRPKDFEPKLENKRLDGNDSSNKSTESSSYTALHGRNPIKSDRPVKALSGKLKQFQNNECLPEPAFEVTLSDFPKLQSARSPNLLDLQKHAWGPLGSAEGDKVPRKPPEKTALSASVTREGEQSLKKNFPTKPLHSSPDPGGFLTETPMLCATVPPQTPKRVVSTPAAVSTTNLCGRKGKQSVPADCKPEPKENASDSELEETVEKKKKKKRNKKKPKPNSETENSPSKSVIYQEPPRIEDDEEFPDLAVAADKKYKPGTPKFYCSTPMTGEQTQEPKLELQDVSFQNEWATPKLGITTGRKAGKQVTSGSVEKRKTQEPLKSSGKKSQIPVQLDLGNMLAALEQKQQAEKAKQSSKPVVLSVGGAVTLPSKESMTATKNHHLNQGNSPHNPLDSSSPLVKKGKQREVPKAKKPTSLKKIILKEREQRKQQHLLEEMAVPKDSAALQDTESTAGSQAHSEDTKAENAEDTSIDPVILAEDDSQVDLKCTEYSSSTENALVPAQLNSNLPKIHSRRFRDYCTQVLSKEVDSCVTDLLKELVRFQDRLYQKDPVKAKTKRRLVMGLREVLKHLKLKKLKCVIISPNCEKIQSKGGLDETLHLIIDTACEQNIPFVFALNRKALGRCLNKAVPVSVVGIFSYDGAQDYFHKMVELTMEARQAYKEMISALERESAEEENGSDYTQSKTPDSENSPLETFVLPAPQSEEDVPDYIKIWKQKLEEEYKPYMLELEKQLTAEMLPMGFEEPHRQSELTP